MGRFGLVGPGYTSRSVAADCQRCVNRFAEFDETGIGKSQATLYMMPGLKRFTTLAKPIRGEININSRAFAVGNTGFYEIFSDGTSTNRGTVETDGAPVSMAASTLQVMIASAGHLYCFTLATNAFVEIDTVTLVALQGRVAQVGFTDSYFVAWLKNSQKFQISGLLNGTTWDPLDIAQISLYSDNIVSMVVDHREVWFFGPKQTVVYYDSGNPDFPFQPLPGAFIEQGCGAQNSVVKADNTIFWLDADERGQGIARRANGYNGARVSNHATEFGWEQYSTISDAISYAFKMQGHTFIQTYFPTAGKTWVLDIENGFWAERESYANGVYGPHLSQCHVFAFGKHLVGDWNSGDINDMSLAYYDENGTNMRRIRIAPHIAVEDEWEYHQRLQILFDPGISTVTLYDGAGNVRSPQVAMQFSDDYGHTWSNEQTRDIGGPGAYSTRTIWRRLGRARDRVYKITDSDPVPSYIIDGYVNSPDTPPVPRLIAQLAKQA